MQAIDMVLFRKAELVPTKRKIRPLAGGYLSLICRLNRQKLLYDTNHATRYSQEIGK